MELGKSLRVRKFNELLDILVRRGSVKEFEAQALVCVGGLYSQEIRKDLEIVKVLSGMHKDVIKTRFHETVSEMGSELATFPYALGRLIEDKNFRERMFNDYEGYIYPFLNKTSLLSLRCLNYRERNRGN